MGKKTTQELNMNKFFLTDELDTKKKEEEPDKRQELYDKLTGEVFNTKDIEVRTDLNTKQITTLSKGLLFADKFDSKVLRDFCENIMKLSLSKNRQSRKEYGEMARASISRQDAEAMAGGMMNGRLWGE